jgi:hypothetical protein
MYTYTTSGQRWRGMLSRNFTLFTMGSVARPLGADLPALSVYNESVENPYTSETPTRSRDCSTVMLRFRQK